MADPHKLLFFAYYFPPSAAIAAVRGGHIATHLHELGWDVTVVTVHPSLLASPEKTRDVVSEMERRGIRQIYTGHRWRLLTESGIDRQEDHVTGLIGKSTRWFRRRLGVDPCIGWYSEACRAGAQITRSDADVILASGAPWISFQAASQVARRLCRPLVLDYRDPWTWGNPHSRFQSSNAERRKEAQLIAQSQAVTIVSPSWASAFQQTFSLSETVHVVANGYDAEEYQGIAPTNFGHFAIVYAGQFYLPKRGLGPLMVALRGLDAMGLSDDWRFHYYGPHSEHVQVMTVSHRLEHRVVIHGLRRRQEVRSAIAGAGVAVVITSVMEPGTLADRGIVTGKVFESIGARTPVLAIAPTGSDLEAVLETTGGGRVFSASRSGEMTEYLAALLRGLQPAWKAPEAYEWSSLAEKMHRVLSQVAERPGKPLQASGATPQPSAKSV